MTRMNVINELTGRFCLRESLNRGVVYISEDKKQVEFGYFPRSAESICLMVGDSIYTCINKAIISGKVFFSNREGCYVLDNLPIEQKIPHLCIKGQYNAEGHDGIFPYTFGRRYEAEFLMDFFAGKQHILNPIEFKIAKHLKYTFGWEFETSMGYIPEDICLRDGLIPLRDGSISGIEYSTVVLNGNEGLNLLKQQCDTLNKYCAFNKECSLHVHLGGFPVNASAIWALYSLLKFLEPNISRYVPPLTFKSGAYKKSHKDYCKTLPYFNDFDELYQIFTGSHYYNSLVQAHPNDPDREHKWTVAGRYHWVNFINMICYKSPKTVEFRLLRPTFDFTRICCWLAIFNAILEYAKGLPAPGKSPEYVQKTLMNNNPSLESIVKSVYPEDISQYIVTFLVSTECGIANQVANGDNCGSDYQLEDDAWNTGKLLLPMEYRTGFE